MATVALFIAKLFSPLTIILAALSVLVSKRWWNLVGVVLLIAVIVELSSSVIQILSTFSPVIFVMEVAAAAVWVTVAVFAKRWWVTRSRSS